MQNFHVDYNVVPFIEKIWKSIGNSISYRFWGRSFKWHSQNSEKMTLNPLFSQKYPKKRYFWSTIFFLIYIFTMFPTLRQLLTYQKRVLETCTFKICIEIVCFSLVSNSKWHLDVWNFLKLRILILFRIFVVTS